MGRALQLISMLFITAMEASTKLRNCAEIGPREKRPGMTEFYGTLPLWHRMSASIRERRDFIGRCPQCGRV